MAGQPSDEEWKKIGKLVDTFYNRPDAQPFREPVPWEELGLSDYPKIITHPMDLGTIKKKIKDRRYASLRQVAEDVNTVWRNCMTYNADGSDFFKLADSLKRKWDDKYQKLCSDLGTSASAAGAASGAAAPAAAPSSTAAAAAASSSSKSLQDKRALAKTLFQIGKEDLGTLLQEVERKCPSALKRNQAEDEVEFNLDELPLTVLQELIQRANSMKGSGGGGSKKSKKAGAAASSSAAAAAGAASATAGGGTSSTSNKKAKVSSS